MFYSAGAPASVWTVPIIVVALLGVSITLVASCGGEGSRNPHPVDFSKRAGGYAGHSVNKTFDKSGEAILYLASIESPSGDVQATVEWSKGLFGSGEDMSGQVNKRGAMHLSGEIYAPSDYARADSSTGEFYHYDGQLNCKFTSASKIRCSYKLVPRADNHGARAQNGEFSAAHLEGIECN